MRHNAPKQRSCGLALRKCRRCGRVGGHIKKYGLHYCRHCFREVATSIGFRKFN
ncbi:30S ribosomal protein S14 [Candidatus Woesearchaeota archaeon]|nr:30S ribosomal protein S14 [Candidatus Woesearchaeota archaeon]